MAMTKWGPISSKYIGKAPNPGKETSGKSMLEVLKKPEPW